jgi:hypothetical protein
MDQREASNRQAIHSASNDPTGASGAEERDLLSHLIDTYHELNAHVRMIPDDRLRARTSDGDSVEGIIRKMRDDELRFSQALKERVTGVAMPDIFGDQAAPLIGAEAEVETAPVLIAQFGSAREVTLAQLRGLADLEWDQAEAGGKSIREHVVELVANDQRQLARIAAQLDTAAPAS